jgi:hypothetical protein
MVNSRRGEIAAELDGRTWTLCLTLGALAELEAAFEVEDLSALVSKFSSGHLSAGDMLKIIGAGLRGGGHPLSDEEIVEMQAEGGALGYARIVTQLLQATFGKFE